MELALYQLDAFTDRVFGGNPAAVCPLPDWLEDNLLQAIAGENNLSETAFLVGGKGQYHLRWFTPTIEVDLCGHATLASAAVVCEHLEPGCDQVAFETRSGLLEVVREGAHYTMDFPALATTAITDPAVLEALAAATGAKPSELRGNGKLLALYESAEAIRAIAPDFARIAALPGDGLIVSAPGEDCDFVSRYFAPHAGIPEDPVTGSAHCVLMPYWAERLGSNRLRARQISKRGGVLDLALSGERVAITGQVAYYMTGTIRLED